MELKEAFASKNTGVIYPKAAWKKANARINAEAYAAQYLMTHKKN